VAEKQSITRQSYTLVAAGGLMRIKKGRNYPPCSRWPVFYPGPGTGLQEKIATGFTMVEHPDVQTNI